MQKRIALAHRHDFHSHRLRRLPEEQAQSSRLRHLRSRRRQDHQDRLLQPARQGPQRSTAASFPSAKSGAPAPMKPPPSFPAPTSSSAAKTSPPAATPSSPSPTPTSGHSSSTRKLANGAFPTSMRSDELARVDMKVSKLPSPVENFTIAYDKSGNGCTMRIDWETTRAIGRHQREITRKDIVD